MLKVPNISGAIEVDLNPLKRALDQAAREAKGFSAAASPSLNQAATLDTGNFSSGLDSMLGGLKSMINPAVAATAAVTAIGTAAAASLAAVGAFLAKTTLDVASAADKLGDMATNAGISAEALSGLGLVAQQAGSDVATVADSYKFLGKNVAEAMQGNKAAIDGFQRMGVAFADARGAARPLEEVMLDVADAIAALPPGAERTEGAMQLLGRGGTMMIATLSQGSGEILKQMEIYKRYNRVITDEQAKTADIFNDSLGEMKFAWEGLQRTVGTRIVDELTPVLEDMVIWTRENFPDIRDTVELAIGTMIESFKAMRPVAMALWGELKEVADAFRLAGNVAEEAWRQFKVPFDIAKEITLPLKGLASTITGPINAALAQIETTLAPILPLLEKAAMVMKGLSLVTATPASIGGMIGSAAGAGGDDGSPSKLMEKPIPGMGAGARSAANLESLLQEAAGSAAFENDLLAGLRTSTAGAGDAVAREAAKIGRAMESLHRDVATFGMSGTDKQLFDFKSMAGVGDAQVAEYERLMKRLNELRETQKVSGEVDRWRESLKGPIEKYEEAIDRLKEWRREQRITEEEFAKGMEKEREKLERGTPAAQEEQIARDPRFAPFIRADSAEAERFKFAAKQDAEADRILRDQLAEAKKQTRSMEDLERHWRYVKRV